jgi:SEC-C motif
MKAGRNDACPCGSGKKYKKCCLPKDQKASLEQTAVISPPPSSVAPPQPGSFLTPQRVQPAGSTTLARPPVPKAPPPPPDPITERADARWREFKSQRGDGRISAFLETLEDTEVMTDDFAFEMLNVLHEEAVQNGNRTRFTECLDALRERRPELYDQGAHYYLSWCLLDALAGNRLDIVPALAKELAPRTGRHIDGVNRAIDFLKYHGQLTVLVDFLRIGWPGVKSSKDILPWGISEFAQSGVDHEIFDYLEHTASPDPADAALLDRVRFFVEEPDEEYLREFIDDLTGKSAREWRADDFALKPHRKKRRDDWDDEPRERPAPDPGKINLSRLISEFVGYLRREEGVPFPRGEMVRQELYRYFSRRHAGELDPRPGMMEAAMNPNLRLPKPPRPAHPLCPERITLDRHLSGMMGMMSGLFHSAAALFQAMPAWLRFLESRALIDAGIRNKVIAELVPLHASLLRIWEGYPEDPHLFRQGQEWPVSP